MIMVVRAKLCLSLSAMADPPKKPSNAQGWSEGLDDAPAAGVNKEMIRRALSMNPNLRQMTNTNDAMRDLQAKAAPSKSAAAKTSDAPKTTTAQKNAPPAIDLLSAIATAEQSFHDEQKTIADEQQKLKARAQLLGEQVLAHVFETVLATDPNMVSPKTAEVLSRHKAFLAEIGFSTKKLVDFQQQQTAQKK